MRKLVLFVLLLLGSCSDPASGDKEAIEQEYTLGDPAAQTVSILYSARHVAVNVGYTDSMATITLKLLPCDSCERLEALKIVELK